jgi:UDP-N-acetylmuramate dehydrogenase
LRTRRVPVTLLGGGSNVLVSDAGVRGLVIRTRGGEVRQIAQDRVRADAAVSINGLVRWTISHGCAGLEAWAGTPGTVGGAIFGNAHFGGRLIGDLVSDVRLASRDGTVADVPGAGLAFAYDRSRLQRSGEVLLSATFRVARPKAAALRAGAPRSRSATDAAARHPQRRLRVPNPDPSGINSRPGCRVPPARWSIVPASKAPRPAAPASPRARQLHRQRGNRHAARDIRQLDRAMQGRSVRRFGVELREEIVYLGDFEETIRIFITSPNHHVETTD